MDNSLIERMPQIIAAEINMINCQFRKIRLHCAVEVGRRLAEAKALVPHGEWGRWLEESVSSSQSTADKLMQLFKEYGAKLLISAAGGEESNSESIPSLGYTQAVILLGVPEEERAEFIAELGMTI